MGDQHDQSPITGPDGDLPIEDMPVETETVRRAASAEFNVDHDVNSVAALREAMDPANRSLADALQASFRVLQFVIVVLLILFVFSGFKTVGANQSGVATVWGRIVDRQGLQPGLQMNWPPPIGEFVLFDSEGREVDDRGVFIPRRLVEIGIEKAMDRSASNDRLMPGEDGSFLTSNGELAHVRVSANYSIADPVRFLQVIPDRGADSIVRVAMERAVVRIGGSRPLQELKDDFSNEEIQELVRDQTQSVLDAIGSGIQVDAVSLRNEIQPPIFIQRIQENFSESRQTSEGQIERARNLAQDVLISSAGESYAELAGLIQDYEALWELDDPGAEEALARINGFFDGEQIAGTSANTISAARRFQSLVDQTLGSEARRFSGLLQTYREHPELVIAERWLEAYSKVMDREDVEIMYVPRGLGEMGIDIAGLESVRDIRRRADLRARESRGMLSGTASDYMMRADEIKIDQAQRQLSIDEATGEVSGMRQERLDVDD